jgi:hypothetical protein
MDQPKLKQPTLFGSAPMPASKATAATKAVVPKQETKSAKEVPCDDHTEHGNLNPGNLLRRILLAKSSPSSWPHL